MQRKWGYLFAGLAAVLMVGAIIVCAANLPDSVAEDGVNRKGSLRADTPNPPLSDGEAVSDGETQTDGETETEVDSDAEPVDDYDYSMPVPQSEAVSEEYFDDAVFIGDSRTEGLIMYTDLPNTTAYTDKGLMVDTEIGRAHV